MDATFDGLQRRSEAARRPPQSAPVHAAPDRDATEAGTSRVRAPTSSSPHANGVMSSPASSLSATTATPGGGRRFPTLSAFEVAGVALQNTFMAGPTRPTQPDTRLRPEAAELEVAIPESDDERVHLALLHAGQAEQLAGLAAEASPPEGAPKRKSLLRRTGKALSRAGRRLGSQVLGTALPSAPALKNVVAVGKGKSASRAGKTVPSEEPGTQGPDWRGRAQALLQERRCTDVKAQMEGHRLKAVEGQVDIVSRLHASAQARQEQHLDDLTEHVWSHQAGLQEELSGARERDAQAQLEVAQQCQALSDARAAHVEVARRCDQVDRQVQLIELRRQACLQSLSAAGAGRIAGPSPDEMKRAHAEVDRLGEELARCAEHRSQAEAQADLARSRDALDALHPHRRPSALEVDLNLCRQELAAAHMRVASRVWNGGPGGTGNDPDLAEALADVKGLQDWKSELEDSDVAGRARALLQGPAGDQVARDLDRLAREEDRCRQAWSVAAKHLAHLEAQDLGSVMPPALDVATSSRPAGNADAGGVDRTALARRAHELGVQRAQAYGDPVALQLQADLAESLMTIRQRSDSLTAAIGELPRLRAEVAAADAALSGPLEGLRSLESVVRAATAVEGAHDRADKSREAVEHQVQGLQQQAEQIGEAAAKMQRVAMMALSAAPPGFTAPDAEVALGPVLERLGARLLAQPPLSARAALPPDAMLEMAISSAAGLTGGDAQRAARALAALADLGPEDLIPGPGSQAVPRGHSKGSVSDAVALAQELVTLPRGRTLLISLMKPSPVSLDEDRMKSVEVHVAAQRMLAHGGSLDERTRDWLTQALAGASACMHDPDGRIEEHRQRVAYHGVRSGFFSDAPGSPYDLADKYMRSVTERMLENAVEAKAGSAAKRMVGKALPLSKPTPFNERAVLAAGKAAVAVGIIDTREQALQELSDAARELHVELGSPPVGLAADLLALVGALQAQCEFRKPEEVMADTSLVPGLAAGRPGWSGSAAALPPLDATRALLASLKDSSAPPLSFALTRLDQALKRADAAMIMAAPQVNSVDDQDNFFTALLNNFQLRDKLKIAGGRILGASTAGLAATDNFIPTAGVQVQLDLRRTQQEDEVLELNLGPQTIYLLIGGQSTKLSRVGGGTGASFGLASMASVLAASIRPLGIDWRRTKDVQSQTGVSLRVMRSNATQADDLAGFNAAVTDMLKWRNARRPDDTPVGGPLEVILSRHPQVSVNLLGDYERRSVRRESTVQSSAALAVPFVTLTGGVAAGSRNWAMATYTTEETGHIRLKEQKKLVQLVRQRGGAAGLRVGLLTTVDTPVGLSAPGLRWARAFDSKTRGVEKIVRLTTVDGALVPHMCRHVIEYAGVDAYARAVRENRKAWVNQALIYGHYPADWPEHRRQLDAERELDEFLTELDAKKNEFMVCQLTHGLTDDLVPQVDALRGLMEVARRAGNAAELARCEEKMDSLLANPANWTTGRLIVTERSNRTEQPGLALGVVAQSSSVAEASHAVMMFPKYPGDLARLYPSEKTTGFAADARRAAAAP